MDGSEVTVVLLGEKGVGKTTFVEHCFEGITSGPRLSLHARAQICGREIRIQMVESPRRDQLIPAIMVILLFDLTCQNSFDRLEHYLEMAQRVSPVALRALVGTKADLTNDRVVPTHEALRFCGCCEPKMPYYETSLEHGDSILLAFQEIMARPLINEYVIKTTTEQETKNFVHEVMEWAILTNSANILSHLRELGYSIPLDIIEEYPTVIRDYLIGEYPLREVARFKHMELKELNETFSWEDSSLMEADDEEPVLSIQDIRPTIHVARSFHLYWQDISLAIFLPSFLNEEALRISCLAHINLSHNYITSLPDVLFQLPLLESLDVSHNFIMGLPSLDVWKPDSRLQVLKITYNRLGGEVCAGYRNGRPLCRHLWFVDLSHNLLSHFPNFLLSFSLKHLDLSHNPAISSLPLGLGRMDHLNTLLLDGLSLADPPTFVVEEGPKAILQYLRLKLENRSLWGSVRVVVVGPHRSGKSTIVSKLTGVNKKNNKALEVVEWKYRGSEIFSFRNKWLTIDLWDFSGDPELEFVYSCFSCSQSLHLVVCDARDGVHGLAVWLSDIQSRSEERVPVMIVFTHMDMLKTREEKDKFKRTCIQWITFHNKQGGNGLFNLMASTSVRSIQEDSSMLASYESDPVVQEALELQDVKGPDISLMPLVLKVQFVNCISGDNIAGLKKALYKIACGTSSAQPPRVPVLAPRQVPELYVLVDELLRQVRARNREQREGQQQVFYSVQELKEILKKPLHQLRCSEETFVSALKFIGQIGTALVHRLHKGQLLVCVDPQVIGSLLQHTVQYCRHTQEEGGNPATIFVAVTHLSMMWGVEPVLSMRDMPLHSAKPPSVTVSQLVHFLCHLKVFARVLPGAMILVPMVPHTLPRSCDPDSTSLVPRRSYVFSYLPSFFHHQVLTLLVRAVVNELSPSCSPASPNQTLPPTTVPIRLPSGAELYLWTRNLFVVIPEQQVKFWIRIRVLDVGLDPLPNCGRVDVHLACPDLQSEARWLMILTKPIDTLIQQDYPGLLDSSRPQKVDVFIPLSLPNSSPTTDGPVIGDCQDHLHHSLKEREGVASPLGTSKGIASGDVDRISPAVSPSKELRGIVSMRSIQGVQSSSQEQGVEMEVLASSLQEDSEPSVLPKRIMDLSMPPGSDMDHSVPSGSNPTSSVLPGSDPTSSVPPGSDPAHSKPDSHPPFGPHRSNDLSSSPHTRSCDLSGSSLRGVARRHHSSSPAVTTLSLAHKNNVSNPSLLRSASSPPLKQSDGISSLRRLSQVLASPLISSGRASGSRKQSKFSEMSWEVLSKQSTTSHRLSIQEDRSDPLHKLVPLWECLQESFKTPVINVDTCRIVMSELIPDHLFSDLSPSLLFRTKGSYPHHYMVSLEERMYGGEAPPPPEESGLFLQSYYSFDRDGDILVRKPAGALKAFYLQSRLRMLHRDMLTLQSLKSPHLVAAVGLQFCPPSLALEASPFGSLHSWMRRLRRKMRRTDTHQIALQLLSALDFFHSHNTSYHSINSDQVLVWNLDPLIVKLSDQGITHTNCQLCTYLKYLPAAHPDVRSYRLDYMCLGLLVYEMATGKRPYGDIYPLTCVVLAILYDKIKLNIEADHFLQKQGMEEDGESECIASGCQRLCLQSCIDLCLYSTSVTQEELVARFSLCAGDHQWSPMRLLVNMEVIVASGEDLVYWVSGSRGLVTGQMNITTGELSYNLLQAAPQPESGLFANRRGKPIPIAVGRATSLALVLETKQLWVGTENGQKGSVYVFNLPDMRRHHNIHLQDAVLSLCAVNAKAEKVCDKVEMRYRVLVGLANGTIIVFLGQRGDKVLDNPLQGPKFVVTTHQRKPCLGMTLTPEGEIWCSCGQTLEVYDIISLKSLQRLTPGHTDGATVAKGVSTMRGDVITLMAVNGRGVWTVGRRCSTVRLWDRKTGNMKVSYSVNKVLQDSSDSDITSMLLQGGALWLGTRNGYLLLLDVYSMLEGKEDTLLGLQHCGQGKVKCIVAIGGTATCKLQVLCSLEFVDEVSCLVLSWEYFPKEASKKAILQEPDTQISSSWPDLAPPSSPTPNIDEIQNYCKSF